LYIHTIGTRVGLGGRGGGDYRGYRTRGGNRGYRDVKRRFKRWRLKGKCIKSREKNGDTKRAKLEERQKWFALQVH